MNTLAQVHLLLAANNSLFHAIGEIFQPIFKLFANILAWIYAIVPNYAAAIALLTILIMGALTPLTVKSTKSMLAMQRLQPEMKKLQQKYKGPENREQLNQELMKLYKEAGVNPASSCIPMFLQMPFLFILYDIIKGLTNTVKVNGHLVSEPRYIPCPSPLHSHTFTQVQTMCHDLVTATPPGAMHALGINLALKPTAVSMPTALPYYGLVLVACALQFVQMAQMNRRNPGATQANPQMRNMQYFMPIIFAVIYINIQSAVVIYMIVSTIVRIVTQDILFRTGVVQPAGEREIGAEPNPSGGARGRLRDALGGATAASLVEGDGGKKPSGAGSGAKGGSGAAGGGGKAAGDKQDGDGASGTAKPNGAKPAGTGGAKTNGNRSKTGSASGNRGASGSGTADDGEEKPKQPQNRARSKRTRKAR